MKIMQIMLSQGDGGLEKHFKELCEGLARNGHDVIAVCNQSIGGALNESVTFEPINANLGRRDPRQLLIIYKLLRRHGPGVCHAQASKAAQTIVPLIKRFHTQMIFVHTVHGIKKNLNFTIRFHLNIAVSKTLERRLPEKANGITVYNGITAPSNTNIHAVRLLKEQLFSGTEVQWLAVGRLVSVKGFDILLRALALVEGRLTIVGDGEDLESLSQLAKELGLEGRVQFLGHRTDIPLLMKAADAVVISSRREGFSYVFLEALFAETAVIATDVPIANEILPPYLICPTDNHMALSTLMSDLNANDAGQQQARAFAKENLTVESMLTNTLNAYKRALNTSN